KTTAQPTKIASPPVTGVGSAWSLRPAGQSSSPKRYAMGWISHSTPAVTTKVSKVNVGSKPRNLCNILSPQAVIARFYGLAAGTPAEAAPSNPVIVPIPAHEVRHAFLHRDDRAIADIGDQIGHVCFRIGHVAGLQRQHVHLRL